MNSFKEKLTTRWYLDYSHKLHMQRLKEIKSKCSQRINNSLPKASEFVNLIKPKEFLKKQRNQSIGKANELIFCHFDEILAGKRKTVTQKILDSAKAKVIKPKSLNKTMREKEFRRIDDENQGIIKRITQQSPCFSISKLEEERAIVSKHIRRTSDKKSLGSRQMNTRMPPDESSISNN